jgi:hypothetical protein
MLKKVIYKLYILFTLALIISLPKSVTSQTSQWQITPGDANGNPQPGGINNLYNTVHKKYVMYGRRKYGINLVWTKSTSFGTEGWKPFYFSRKNKDDKSLLKYGELVAMNAHRGGYIKYKKRRNGINLVWSKTPVYQWKITGGEIGMEIEATHGAVGLYNTKHKDHIVYCKRSRGINLRWAKDCESKKSKKKEISFVYTVKALETSEGVRPYSLTWNPGPPNNAYMKSLQIIKPAGFPTFTAFLFKKGEALRNCGMSSAGITLNEGDKISGKQLKTLYGTEKPRPPVNILACVSTDNNRRLDSFKVRITYIRE